MTIRSESERISGLGGVVVCGGQSRRMGTPKALLKFGGEWLLNRILASLGAVCEKSVVVAAVGQELPPLPDGVSVIRDQHEDRGPLEGIACGLSELARQGMQNGFVTGCDYPLLSPAWIKHLSELKVKHQADIAVPSEEKYQHVLSAVYSCDVFHTARQLIDEDKLRPLFLLERHETVRCPVESLRTIDPELDSLKNMNNREDYEALQKYAGQ